MIKITKVLISNNPKVKEYEDRFEIIFIDTYAYWDVLDYARHKVHSGWILETHPLSGSIKPNETPYKSIIMTKKPENSPLNFNSLKIIEDSIETYNKFHRDVPIRQWSDEVLNEFSIIDLSLIKSAISSMGYDY